MSSVREIAGRLSEDELSNWMRACAERDAAEVGTVDGTFAKVTEAFYWFAALQHKILKDRDLEEEEGEYFVIDPTSGCIYVYHLDD